jgi:hypothetical protein
MYKLIQGILILIGTLATTATALGQVSNVPELMARGIWVDSRTGLMWARCVVGQTWTGSTCTGMATHPGVPFRNGSPNVELINAQISKLMSGYEFAGFTDWRIPTIQELQALLPCSNGVVIPEEAGETVYFACPGGGIPQLDPSVFPDSNPNVYPNYFKPVSTTASASDRCNGSCTHSLNWMVAYIDSKGNVSWQGTKIYAVRGDVPNKSWQALLHAAPLTIEANKVRVNEMMKQKQAREDEERRVAEDQARAFRSLGKCAIGESVFHRELIEATGSSGNVLADAIWNSHTKAQYVIEYEAVVEGFVGSKVKTIVNDYRVKQISEGNYVDADDMRSRVAGIGDKLVGKVQFYDRARCSK